MILQLYSTILIFNKWFGIGNFILLIIIIFLNIIKKKTNIIIIKKEYNIKYNNN